jgi:hypothetical protein
MIHDGGLGILLFTIIPKTPLYQALVGNVGQGKQNLGARRRWNICVHAPSVFTIKMISLVDYIGNCTYFSKFTCMLVKDKPFLILKHRKDAS